MPQTICRMYNNHEHATALAGELVKEGYDDVHKFGTADGNSSIDSLVDDMVKAYIVKHEAQIYARNVSKGSALVVVHAPFGHARRAMTILGKYPTIDSGVSEPAGRSVAWDERTPMSSALQMPVLAKNRRPFEKVWNLPSLTRKPFVYSACLGMPMQTQSATPLSTSIGWAPLSKTRRFLYKT